MKPPMTLQTTPITDVKIIRGSSIPASVGFRQVIVTGPPDCGKSTLVRSLGGWPEEGYLDLAQDKWWLSRLLTFRPREVHLGIAFLGYRESHAVFDSEWVDEPSDVALEKIRIPPAKRGFFSVNWRQRFAFDFQLPPVEQVYKAATARARSDTPTTNAIVTREQIARQLAVHELIALHIHRRGMIVYVRREFQGPPLRIVDIENEH